jgi:hypothetical protein
MHSHSIEVQRLLQSGVQVEQVLKNARKEY